MLQRKKFLKSTSKYSEYFNEFQRLFTCNYEGCSYSKFIATGGSTNCLKHHLNISHEVFLPNSGKPYIAKRPKPKSHIVATSVVEQNGNENGKFDYYYKLFIGTWHG